MPVAAAATAPPPAISVRRLTAKPWRERQRDQHLHDQRFEHFAPVAVDDFASRRNDLDATDLERRRVREVDRAGNPRRGVHPQQIIR